MAKKLFIIAGLSIALLAAGCSDDSDSDESRGSGIEGHSDAIVRTEDEVVDALQQLWQDAGASEELATCYAEFLRTEGLAEDVQNLDDLARVQSEFTDEQGQAFADCGTN